MADHGFHQEEGKSFMLWNSKLLLSAKIQIWVALIDNLLLTLLQRSLKHSWSFSGLASIIRIILMYYLNLESVNNDPESDLRRMIEKAQDTPPEPSIFDCQIY